jgi:hypothetical protein
MPADKKIVQFPGEAETPVNPGILWLVPAKDHPDGHYASGHRTAGAAGAADPDGKAGREPDDLFRVAEPELVVNGLYDRFGTVELAGAIVLLCDLPDP